MYSIRRSCQSAVLTRTSISVFNNASQRAFSCSNVCRRGALPVFLEASSPELTTLLKDVTRRVLLPNHLTKDQATLVYKKENKAKLEAEPIEITLGDVTLPLEHIDRLRDVPRRWTIVNDIIKRSKTPEDWENVVRLMEGFENSGHAMKPAWKELIVRHLGVDGHHQLILKAAQRASATGLRLNEDRIVRTVLRAMHYKALESNWDAEETQKALVLVEQFLELMENDEHMGKKQVQPGDIRASPLTIAIPLELAAVRAKKYTDGKDTDGKVAKYASRFMHATKQDDFLTQYLPAELTLMKTPIKHNKKSYRNTQAVVAAKYRVHDMLPMWVAVRAARQVLGPDMPMALDAQKLEEDIKEAIQTSERLIIEKTYSKETLYALVGKLSDQIRLAEAA